MCRPLRVHWELRGEAQILIDIFNWSRIQGLCSEVEEYSIAYVVLRLRFSSIDVLFSSLAEAFYMPC